MEFKHTIGEQFIHIVFFWLKNPTNENDKKEFEQAMHLIAEGDIDVSPMVTGQVGLNDIAQAFSDLSQADQHTKIMVMPLMA